MIANTFTGRPMGYDFTQTTSVFSGVATPEWRPSQPMIAIGPLFELLSSSVKLIVEIDIQVYNGLKNILYLCFA